jgi:hypothetical protein
MTTYNTSFVNRILLCSIFLYSLKRNISTRTPFIFPKYHDLKLRNNFNHIKNCNKIFFFLLFIVILFLILFFRIFGCLARWECVRVKEAYDRGGYKRTLEVAIKTVLKGAYL